MGMIPQLRWAKQLFPKGHVDNVRKMLRLSTHHEEKMQEPGKMPHPQPVPQLQVSSSAVSSSYSLTSGTASLGAAKGSSGTASLGAAKGSTDIAKAADMEYTSPSQQSEDLCLKPLQDI